jgi:predicted nucleic acid-binding protein
MQKSFVDTNLWIYSFIESPENSKREITISFLEKTSETSQIYVSIQVINEIHWVLTRKYKLSEEVISKKINGILNISYVLPVSLKTYGISKNIRYRYNISFWDSLLISSALEGNVQVFYSEDLQNGLIIENLLRVKNPFLFETTI